MMCVLINIGNFLYVFWIIIVIMVKFSNEQQVIEENFHQLLTPPERIHLLGTEHLHLIPDYAIVYPIYTKHRRKRSTAIDENDTDNFNLFLNKINLSSSQLLFNNSLLNLTLKPININRLIDLDNFFIISRWKNHSIILPENLIDAKNQCYFQSSNAALSTCNGIRGIIGSNDNDDTYYVIHPLPQRFRKTISTDVSDIPHIITRRNSTLHDNMFYPIHQQKLWKKHKRKKYESKKQRQRRAIMNLAPGIPVHVETAIFVDHDLFQHMKANYPTDTERELIRFVLAMINAVQLLYHDESLGRPVNFLLKRLEILHEEPNGLQRPHDIDRFLSSFCLWQQSLNPPQDSDPTHWDHALILTGLDLYVVSKHGKISTQVVGLAPVAGMCTTTSSCTVNEGRHFESVYVVAHEIGHNLGMRHDGPHAENDCDPSSFIMSPTLGSGKITWSPCSRKYLQTFLETSQSRCLLDHGSTAGQLDHTAEGTLPGERFDADQQCMLKYGRGSRHSRQQPLDDICRDLHCQRDRYTWTSHPALEGTSCSPNMWCRSGRCVGKGSAKLRIYTKGGVPIHGGWTPWTVISDCASGCLYGEEGRLRAGSTGIILSVRECSNPIPENGGRNCDGFERKYQACNAMQCLNVPRMTITEFADQICGRAREVDSDLLGTGLQRISSDSEEACMVWCNKRGGGSKTRGWTFPDGTVCHLNRQRRFGKPSYCINGRCEEFVCDQQYNKAMFLNLPELCVDNSMGGTVNTVGKWKNNPRRRDSDNQWAIASGCHSNCMSPGTGIRLVIIKRKPTKSSIQLCQPDKLSCGRLKTPLQYATNVCTKYKERVRRLSGLGMQISPALEDPDRPCRVACQDENVSHRFYLVNGEEGWFPFGTDCSRGSRDKKSYCISGKCLEFGSDGTPLTESEFTLPLLSRSKRSIERRNGTKVTAILDQHELDKIISQLNLTYKDMVYTDYPINYSDKKNSDIQIDLTHPIIHHMVPTTSMFSNNMTSFDSDYNFGSDNSESIESTMIGHDNYNRDYYNEVYGIK